jgi:multiple sugar transport system permease protein
MAMAALTVLFIIVSSLALGAAARLAAQARRATRKQQADTFAGYLFAAPWIVGFLIFVVVPLGFSLYWSFTDYRVTSSQPPNWLWLDNYRTLLLQDDNFRASLINTLYLTVVGLPLQMGVALLLAVLLNQKAKGERIFRMAFYLPVILGFNTAVWCWRLMLNTGPASSISSSAATQAVLPWLSDPRRDLRAGDRDRLLPVGCPPASSTCCCGSSRPVPAGQSRALWVQSPLWSKMSVVMLMIWPAAR